MNQGGACAYGEEVRAEALPLRKEKKIKRSLTCWNTVFNFAVSLFCCIFAMF